MLGHSHLQQQSNNRLLWSGVLAVGILWLSAVWNFGAGAEYRVVGAGRPDIAVSVDMPPQAASEHSLKLKRFFASFKNQPKSAEPVDPIWALQSSESIVPRSSTAAKQNSVVNRSPHFSLYQLQTLNISRAPPRV